MFGGRDPFGQMFGEMHRSMREMDQMMNQMMDPFGAFGLTPRQPFVPSTALEDGQQRARGHAVMAPRADMMMRDPFGFGFPDLFAQRRQTNCFAFPDIFREMNGMAQAAMNDPNGMVYSSSTMISLDGSGRPPRVVETSTRRSGDVKETRRRVQNGEEEEMVIGHAIGEREHVLEKKRDKDGNVRKQQKFRNLDQDEAEAFDREFQSRAEQNVRNSGFGDVFGYRNGGRSAIDGTARSGYSRPREISSRDGNGPIITLPDEDDAPRRSRPSASSSSHSPSGPIIREISEEEAEQSIPKRRREMFARYRVGDE
ncbi:hypothetical protein PENTCL1PPCAC_6225 [Pristionchus entomophagus]|uniref:Myeloid leukemia factor n=1 Tax=Pristionchus entomophagus TaxID=358040 RepID=A0AAV5SM46_9BILA|nr:hypothetical protein PENTCL1PPCAC_6225 [Pristionchus entomophagus]